MFIYPWPDEAKIWLWYRLPEPGHLLCDICARRGLSCMGVVGAQHCDAAVAFSVHNHFPEKPGAEIDFPCKVPWTMLDIGTGFMAQWIITMAQSSSSSPSPSSPASSSQASLSSPWHRHLLISLIVQVDVDLEKENENDADGKLDFTDLCCFYLSD